MNALVLESPGNLVLRPGAAPGLPAPGEALVRVHRVGVCGTDLHAFHGQQPFFQYPRILGHELGVEVLAVGEGVTRVRPGDRAAVEPYLSCGHCIACRRDRPNCCRTLRVLGVHVDGGQQEQLIVPADKLHGSARLDFDQLALVETLGIGAHAVDRAALEPGETVAIVGAGPIGLATLQFAQAAGARVIVIDVNASRLTFCQNQLGVAPGDLIDARDPDAATWLEALTDGDMPTAVFDATGNQQSMQDAFHLPAAGGRLVFVGLFRGSVHFDDPGFHRRELTLLASRNARSADFTRIIDLIESGRVDTRPWITHRAGCADVPREFAGWTRRETSVLKAMIHFT